jgi:acid phosphatase (class A)
MKLNSLKFKGVIVLVFIATAFNAWTIDVSNQVSSISDPKISKPDSSVIFDGIPIFSSLKRVDQPNEKKDFELLLVMERQAHVNDIDLKRARSEDTSPDVYQFHDVLGDWFNKDNKHLPHTARLFDFIASKVVSPIINDGKIRWNRLRPYFQNEQNIKFLGLEDQEAKKRLQASPSFPSGHAANGMMYALVLSDIVPEYRDKFLARGMEFGDHRVLLGVHFPSDVAAGRLIASKIYAAISQQPGYKAAIADAKTEFTAEMDKSQVKN